jgi:hypothetical protein
LPQHGIAIGPKVPIQEFVETLVHNGPMGRDRWGCERLPAKTRTDVAILRRGGPIA